MGALTRKLLLSLMLLGLMAGSAFAAVLPADATNVREIKIFRNVSGASTTSGTAFILQNANSDANVLIGTDFGQESSLGLDVTTTTSADVESFVGVQLDDTCVDDGLCRVVTWGPAIARWAGLTDNTNTRMATIGTTTVAGLLGSGSNAGITMSLSIDASTTDTESNGTSDSDLRWVFVKPGAD